jgi:hypothetical protein
VTYFEEQGPRRHARYAQPGEESAEMHRGRGLGRSTRLQTSVMELRLGLRLCWSGCGKHGRCEKGGAIGRIGHRPSRAGFQLQDQTVETTNQYKFIFIASRIGEQLHS